MDLWPKESIGKPTRVPAATFDQTFIQNFANPSPPPQNLAKYTSPHPLLDRPTFGWQNNLKESNGSFFLNTVRDSICREENISLKTRTKLGPVGSTVRYELMKLCTGSV